MPSPFPGMDPFIEGQRWEDFHHEFLSQIRAPLVLELRPRYDVRVEERVIVEFGDEDDPHYIEPDLSLIEGSGRAHSAPTLGGGAATATATAVREVVRTLSMPRRRREAFLTVRDVRSGRVVTVIEVLSPANKATGAGKREAYLEERAAVLLSSAHLVEIDLLRGGRRLPTVEPLPEADYYAIVCRKERRPEADVYYWRMPHPLPTLPIPLAERAGDIQVDLQRAFTDTYDRAGYDYGLDYERPVRPKLSEADAVWVQAMLQREETPLAVVSET